MDATTAFVHEFCNQVAKMDAGLKQMKAFYIFEDKRPGSLEERFLGDAREFGEYQKMFQV